jgi:LPS-assembly lipoprotein
MSWSRRALLSLLLLPLGGCGFHPLYGEETLAADEPALAAIVVLPIPDRIGQQLELSLREALNPHGISVEPRYRLATRLVQIGANLGIQRDATSTRGRVDVYVTMILTDFKTGKSVYSSRSQSTSSFNILQDAYAAQVAEEDARTRTVRDLTAEIRTRLALFVRQQQKQQTQKTNS